MTVRPVSAHFASKEAVEPSLIRVGKDIIELVTMGMYVSPITIYREYVQNSADAIDAAQRHGLLAPGTGSVVVEVDDTARRISVRDNGTGVPAPDALPILLSLGGSPKRLTKARGFRGVGRLSGLAYCRQLEFKTKAAGEDRTTSLLWDCRALRERLSDAAFSGDLRQAIAGCVEVRVETAPDRAQHFFEVTLRDVSRLRNDILLNEDAIAGYLGQVAPVPFSPDFSFGQQIDEELARSQETSRLSLSVAGRRIYRPFRDDVATAGGAGAIKIHEIEFIRFADVDGGDAAVGWIAHHDYVRSFPSTLGVRGLRARLGDLQVGEANLFDDVFKEPRFNAWTIGELHILDRRLVPNARRDNFEVNHHYYNLLVQLGPAAAQIAQRCRSASISRNAVQSIKNATDIVQNRLKRRQKVDRAELSRLKALLIRARPKLRRVLDPAIRKCFDQLIAKLETRLSRLRPKRGASVITLLDAATLISRVVTNRKQAQRLIEELTRHCV